MPSPLGHALGGVAAGWGVARARAVLSPDAALYAALGVLPDVDLLLGVHSTYTHSVGAATLVAIAAAMLPRRVVERVGGSRRIVFALACGAAYASHVLLDWLGSDTTPPIGIMALWPISSAFYQSDLHWFMAISRRYWLPGFLGMNLLAAWREVLILGPVVALVRWLRSLRRAGAVTSRQSAARQEE